VSGLLQTLGTGLGHIASIAIVFAVAMLWMRRRTPWLMIALIGEIGSFACHVLVTLSPTMYMDLPILRVLWPLSSCVFALGLLCHALFENAANTGAAENIASDNTSLDPPA
jgi:ABC-type thiamin/hydroxymethylpyrimidine transport system permease subunit